MEKRNRTNTSRMPQSDLELFKNKGCKSDGANYRGISLLSNAETIIERVILNRLTSSASARVPARSPVLIQTWPQHRQCRLLCQTGPRKMQHMANYAVFIDLTKAFDTVNREALSVILAKLDCSRKFTNLIHLFHEGMKGLVDASTPFEITNGVKQGFVLAPVLFNLFFTCVLTHALRDLARGVQLRYRLDGSVFDAD